jgi:hypothetical protein
MGSLCPLMTDSFCILKDFRVIKIEGRILLISNIIWEYCYGLSLIASILNVIKSFAKRGT